MKRGSEARKRWATLWQCWSKSGKRDSKYKPRPSGKGAIGRGGVGAVAADDESSGDEEEKQDAAAAEEEEADEEEKDEE
jgi:hypothetical protein